MRIFQKLVVGCLALGCLALALDKSGNTVGRTAHAGDAYEDEMFVARQALAEALEKQKLGRGQNLSGSGREIAEVDTPIPYFDVEAYCSTHKECIIQEQQAYDALKIEWSELTEEERQKIIFAATNSASMKYKVAEYRARSFIELREFYKPAPKFRY